MIRIQINLDFLTDDPVEAYGMLRKIMRDVELAHNPRCRRDVTDNTGYLEGWESTDTWLNCDDVEMTKEEIAQACKDFYEKYLDLDKFDRE